MRRVAFVGLATFLFAGIVLGEDFWVKKDYTQWSEEEVKKIMTNSPWAKDVIVSAPAGALGGARRGPASATGVDVESTGGGGGRGGRGGRGGGAGGGEDSAPSEVQITLNVSWRSALPLRKAVVKSRAGASAEVPADMKEMLAKEQEDYVVVVSGIPARMVRLIQDPVQLNKSTLKIGKKAPVAPKGVDFQTRTQTVDVFFVFPKKDPATLDDKDLELDLKLGGMSAKRKFNLK